MARRILIVYAKSFQEVFNRQSALGAYIHCVGKLLEEAGYSIWLNGVEFSSEVCFGTSKNVSKSRLKVFLNELFPKLLKRCLREVYAILQAEMILRRAGKHKYDCIIEFYSFGSHVGRKLSFSQSIPLNIIYDAPVLEEFHFFNEYHAYFKNVITNREVRSLKTAKRIIVYSNPVKKYLFDKVKRELPVLIHQNVDFTRFEFIERAKFKWPIRIGFIGSFLKWHKVGDLLSAFDSLLEQGYRVELYLIGTGMEYDEIRETVSLSKNRRFIQLTGYLDGEELLAVKRRLHIGVMPGSNWYGAPNKIFEYGAARLAVVAPNTPTISDIFQNRKNIFLFNEGDDKALFNTLKEMLDNIEEAFKIATQLQFDICNNHSETRTLAFYESILSETINP